MHNKPPRTAVAMAVVLAALALSACTAPRQPDIPQTQSITTYDCNRGNALVMHWPTKVDGPAVLEMNGVSHLLEPERVASGFGFGSGGTYVRGKGNGLLVQPARATPVRCGAR